jgi:hypothetical protein
MDQYTFVRDGRLYHADQETVKVLQAVQQWDEGSEHNAAHDLLARGLANGRIGEGQARALDHPPVHEQTPSHAARIDGTPSPASPRPRASGQGYDHGD